MNIPTYKVPKTNNPDAAHHSKLDRENEGPVKPNYVDKDFSQKMIEARRILGWTRKDLARSCGLSEQVISLYETGKALKNDKEMNKIQLCIQRTLNKKK